MTGSRATQEAGYAVRQAAGVKRRQYADHPAGNEFVPLAVDVHGAIGTRWLDLLQRLARLAVSSRQGQQSEQPGFNAAGSLAQVFRMRLAISLQRSLAFAVHLRAGRALAAASEFRQGDVSAL
eukprot:SM000183S03973  [mRNA]  locus=s183:23811:24179:- [translate_table: standard]